MAITQNPLIGQASGSAGGLTFQYYQRKNVLRRKPFCPRDPATPAQIISRKQFKTAQIHFDGDINRLLKMLYPGLRYIYKAKNAFISLLTNLPKNYHSPAPTFSAREIVLNKSTLPAVYNNIHSIFPSTYGYNIQLQIVSHELYPFLPVNCGYLVVHYFRDQRKCLVSFDTAHVDFIRTAADISYNYAPGDGCFIMTMFYFTDADGKLQFTPLYCA